METRLCICRFAALGLTAVLLGLPRALPAAAPANSSGPAVTNAPAAATNAPAAEVIITKSEFDHKLAQGRDPFFPRSTRRHPVPVAKPTVVAGVVQKPAIDYSQLLFLKGISGSANRRLAIINDRSFAVGEDQEVTTPNGKALIHCKEIRDQSVLISFGNPPQPLELRLPGAY